MQCLYCSYVKGATFYVWKVPLLTTFTLDIQCEKFIEDGSVSLLMQNVHEMVIFSVKGNIDGY